MDQTAKVAHGSLHVGCTKLPGFCQGGWRGSCPRQKGALESTLFKVEALKTVLGIHHPQKEVLGCLPWREGSAWQLDPQQLPRKNNPEGTCINKIHFASPNITRLSSRSPSNVLIPFQPFSVSLPVCLSFSMFLLLFPSSSYFFPHFFFEEQHPLPSHSLFPVVSSHVLHIFCITLSIFSLYLHVFPLHCLIFY